MGYKDVFIIKNPSAAYIHIPFCKSKCFYCDFNSYPGMEEIIPEYADALICEIRQTQTSGSKLDSVYFGGGTPTLLTFDKLTSILQAVISTFGLAENAEVTIEANPGALEQSLLAGLQANGFNRLSIGIQSFDDDILTRIGRIHTAKEALEAFSLGREAGFSNISIDLIYALPGQSILDWQNTLDMAVSLKPEHVSLYELTVEEGTVFGNLKKQCLLQLPDEDLQIEMYQSAINILTSAGYEHYEISNFALPGFRSQHNQVYWRNEPYYGFGAGATGYADGIRYTNISSPEAYIAGIRSTGRAVASSESITGRQSMGETVMLGLRMMDGVDLDAFKLKYGVDLSEVYSVELNKLAEKGLIKISGSRFSLTQPGLLVANDIAAEFL